MSVEQMMLLGVFGVLIIVALARRPAEIATITDISMEKTFI